jgi:hypothetical protein
MSARHRLWTWGYRPGVIATLPGLARVSRQSATRSSGAHTCEGKAARREALAAVEVRARHPPLLWVVVRGVPDFEGRLLVNPRLPQRAVSPNG